VHIGPAPAGWWLVRQPREKRKPGHRLRDRAEGRVMVMPAGMAVTRHRHIDDVRLYPALLLVAEAPVAEHARAEILDHDVGDADQPLGDLQALGGADVEAEALFVDVGVVAISRGVQVDLKLLRRGRAWQPAGL